jgi:DNA-binding FrmR family transcriptional regulator
MPPAAFEPAISGGERPQTHASDRTATVTGYTEHYKVMINKTLYCYHVLTNCSFQTTISAATAVLEHVMSQPLHRMFINKVRHAEGQMKQSRVSGIVSKIVTVVYDGKN